MPKTSRRESREIALQILFQNEFLKIEECRQNLETFSSGFSVPQGILRYAEKLLDGVFRHLKEIDALITARSENWSTQRMPLVDLNILRVAIFEMRFFDGSVPPKVCVNEAIEIAKKYGGNDSASFINGILDPLTK